MDIQTICSSPPQLPDCVFNHRVGDVPALPMDVLSSRK
ncbi:hypothetical protein SLEP1_g2563 [Rubroshorea leprosula]|nr:hypothetical protein SLEP1_g2563 [Rubroshorea leprosula]